MDARRLVNRTLSSRIGDPLLAASGMLLYIDPLRKLSIRFLDGWLAARGER